MPYTYIDYEDDWIEPKEISTPEILLAKKLKMRRVELNIPQRELAEKVNSQGFGFNFTQPKISHMERNGKILATELFAVVKALGDDIRNYVV